MSSRLTHHDLIVCSGSSTTGSPFMVCDYEPVVDYTLKLTLTPSAQMERWMPTLTLKLAGPSLSQPSLALLCSSALLLLSGCGGSSAQLREDPQRAASCQRALSAYPAERYLRGSGAGASQAEAIKAAQAELSSQISAQLSSDLTVSAVQEGDGPEEQTLTQDLRVSTRFAHAELIKTISACVSCAGQSCEARVALSRDEVAERIIQELGPDAERLSASLSALTPQRSLLSFTPAWRSAHASYERLRPQLNQLQLIGRVPRALIHVSRDLGRADKLKAERVQRLGVQTRALKLASAGGQPVATATSAQIDAALRQRLHHAIDKMGLKTHAAEGCPVDASAEVLVIQPQGLLSCSLGLVGPQCALSLSVEMSLCPSVAEPQLKSLGAADWSTLKLVGVHPQSEAGALQRLINSINDSELSAQLARSLSPFVPF